MFYDLRIQARMQELEVQRIVAEGQHRRVVQEHRRSERDSRARERAPTPPQQAWAW